MAEVQQIISQQGPLPIQATANIETDGPVVVTLAGSVWTPTAGRMIGVALLIDGTTEINAQIFSNGPNTHRAVIPVNVPYTFTIGEHSFELVPLTGDTTSDANDFFSVTVLY
ncbi:MAG: hypothetical protein M3321_12390 [Actinomycetota bacterium]|nr:hypothetical protein [Actinomycetota bacterium]